MDIEKGRRLERTNRSKEKSEVTETTQSHITEETSLHGHYCEILKSHRIQHNFPNSQKILEYQNTSHSI
jgi:hypothetical protein